MLGREVKFQPIQNASGFGGFEDIVQGGRVMRIQLIFHEDTAFGLWRTHVDQIMHAHDPVHFDPALGHFDVPPVLKWRKEHEQIGGAA